MDWITGIQRALDYTEAHLTEEIDYEKAAKEPVRLHFIFRECSVCCAVILWASTSVCAG